MGYLGNQRIVAVGVPEQIGGGGCLVSSQISE